ncbi:MAG: flippase [Thermosphaera sp.]
MLWRDTVVWLQPALRSSVAKNVASLYVIQFANYILPLITVPYLLRVLGPSGFGMVAFGQSLIAYFALFVDYGFNLSATRKISVERENIIAVSRTASTIWVAKAFLCIAGMIVLSLLVDIVSKLQEVSVLLLILYGTVIGNVLFPIWLFQGMEKMVFISMINLMMRLFVVAGIFMIVRRQGDYLIYAGLMSLGSIGAGLAGAGIALSKFKLHLVIPSLQDIWGELKGGWMLFLSMASVSLYTAGNAFILGLLTNPTVVGYYSAGEKFIRAVQGLLGPISQAVYPRLSKMASESKNLTLQWGRKILVLMGGLGFTLSMGIFISSPLIVQIILGPDYRPSIMVIRILCWICFLIATSNVLGIQIMIPFGKDRAFTFILFSAGLINIMLAMLLAPIWQESGMAVAVLLSESFVTGTMFIYLSRCQLNPLLSPQLK